MKRPRRTRVSATGEINGYSEYITERGIMKDRMLKILELAMEVNEATKYIIVSVDYASLSSFVNIYDFATGTRKTYWSARDFYATALEGWIVDHGFEQAESALKEILKGVQAA